MGWAQRANMQRRRNYEAEAERRLAEWLFNRDARRAFELQYMPWWKKWLRWLGFAVTPLLAVAVQKGGVG